MNTNGRHANQFFILVNVTFKLGVPQYAYLAFADGSDASSLTVAPGDQVGWYVRVEAGSGWSTPAYTLTFKTVSPFGLSPISVPGGGASGFYTVVAMPAPAPLQYTLAVSGVSPASDPDIQVDPNAVIILGASIVPQHNVRWTVATNAMEYQFDLGPWQPFPAGGVALAVGDQVQFFGDLVPPPDFEIVFPSGSNSHVWASPFSVTDYLFNVAVAGGESTQDLSVRDKSDSGKRFAFFAALTDGSAQSNTYFFTMS